MVGSRDCTPLELVLDAFELVKSFVIVNKNWIVGFDWIVFTL